jgi:protein-disulfide isomerase
VWALGAAAVCAGLLVLPLPPRACATPRMCSKNLWETVFPKPAAKPAAAIADGGALSAPAAAVPRKQVAVANPASGMALRSAEPGRAAESRKAEAAAPVAVAAVGRKFKEYGLDNAPLTCEVYSDYQCPACAKFHSDVIPLLVSEYVQTGKMKLVYHDFPLRMHPYAMLAARYADAAGEAGYYDKAVQQIFETQWIWSANGDVEGQLAQALPPGAMQAVRELVKSGSSLDEGIAADVAKGNEDGINGTPTMVIVSKGKRQAVRGGLSWELLKSYLDGLLGQ